MDDVIDVIKFCGATMSSLSLVVATKLICAKSTELLFTIYINIRDKVGVFQQAGYRLLSGGLSLDRFSLWVVFI